MANRFPIRIPHHAWPKHDPFDVLEAKTQAEIVAWLESPEGVAAMDKLFEELKQMERSAPPRSTCSPCPGHVYG